MSSRRSGCSDSEASVRQSARISLPSASVFPISTVCPLLLWMTSLGRNAFPATQFSTQGRRTRSFTSSLAPITMEARLSTLAAPPMSFFMVSMLLGGLMSRPPVSKQTPLPTMVTRGASALLLALQTMSTTSGSLPEDAALPTAWTSGKPLSSSDPLMTFTFAPWALPNLSAERARSAGPKSLHGVLIRSRPRNTESTMSSHSRLLDSSSTQSFGTSSSSAEAPASAGPASSSAGEEVL
mmetsp:Transcript_1564/g.4900  ORF Transcript_1564/g.4900 Transcript_1564/m.4900 type:complete len:239 (-) Transcript_1564:657-1373(-)